MPIIPPLSLSASATLHCWHIIETQQELNNLAHNNAIILPTITAHKRIQQSIAWRLLVHNSINQLPINYVNNKPVVDDGYISVSHTNNYAYVLHAHSPCGIDAEAIGNKAARIKLKFCTAEECALFDATKFTDEEFYTLLWCVKEAMYKRYNDGYSFINQLKINSIDTQHNSVSAQIITPHINEICTVHYLTQNNMYIAYTL